ncbi:MAG: tetratricopeptide repeat protein [Fuerstiella sp.]|nr:tetratricopeptide repeat protein [Fuerstiella sp.]
MSDSENANIISATSETFRADVVEASMQLPVVADFWADWCAPCRQLMPILEKLANEYAGRFRLVKINVDECPEIAGAIGVQSIPLVLGFIDGQPATQLPGAHDETAVRSWLDGFLPSPAVEAWNTGLAAETEGRIDDAESEFRKALELDPDKSEFAIALARVLLAQDRIQECAEIIEKLESRGFLEADAEALKDQLSIRSQVEDSGGTTRARAELAADPENCELQIRLAEALGVDKKFEESCEMLLEVIRNNFGEHRDQAKDAMVGVLAMMGPKSQLASKFRRQLSTAYY